MYQVWSRYWWRWMCAWLRSRGLSPATRYHDVLKNGPLMRYASMTNEPITNNQWGGAWRNSMGDCTPPAAGCRIGIWSFVIGHFKGAMSTASAAPSRSPGG